MGKEYYLIFEINFSQRIGYTRKNANFKVIHIWFPILFLQFITYKTLSKLLKISEPQCSYL